jgi:hypothetical protein
LPAHAVIIKGKQIYTPEKGRWVELSSQDVFEGEQAGAHGVVESINLAIVTVNPVGSIDLEGQKVQVPARSQKSEHTHPRPHRCARGEWKDRGATQRLDGKAWGEAWVCDLLPDVGVDLDDESGARKLYASLVQEVPKYIRAPPRPFFLLPNSRTPSQPRTHPSTPNEPCSLRTTSFPRFCVRTRRTLVYSRDRIVSSHPRFDQAGPGSAAGRLAAWRPLTRSARLGAPLGLWFCDVIK